MYNEIIKALEEAAKDDGVITVLTGPPIHCLLCQIYFCLGYIFKKCNAFFFQIELHAQMIHQ